MFTVALTWPIYLFAFMLGAITHSFIGLAVDRLPHQLKWRQNPITNFSIFSPRSRCEYCLSPIKWCYLIPVVGYLLCSGKCPLCATKITKVYPIMECCGGLLVVILLYIFGLSYPFVIYWLLFSSLFFLSWIDIREHWLPLVVTLPLFWLGLIGSPSEQDPLQRIEGASTAFCLLYILMLLMSKSLRQDIIAGGDIALFTVAGAWLGLTWLPYYSLLSSGCFMIYAVPLRLQGRVFCPMGPALSCGFSLCLIRSYYAV